ncbi:MAG: type II toxin-antitoxin system HicB family antitoxin [Candidatus Vogelbacteria bacterium]|nr:type II toxin-antitoxin system HicB family antitoxin [Candidatus Vogelbacteria bacterium]
MKKAPILKNTNFTAFIEKGESGYYIGSVPSLPGCHTQAKDLSTLASRLKEAIVLYLEAERSLGQKIVSSQFVGIQTIELAS